MINVSPGHGNISLQLQTRIISQKSACPKIKSYFKMLNRKLPSRQMN